jgi:hypothetical protein
VEDNQDPQRGSRLQERADRKDDDVPLIVLGTSWSPIPDMKSDPMDIWVLKVSLLLPLVFLALLGIWHLLASLADRFKQRKRRTTESPSSALAPSEPSEAITSFAHLNSMVTAFQELPDFGKANPLAAEIKNDPELLERACASLTNSLADTYLALAESWTRKGNPERAAEAYRKLVQTCPETRQAQIAQEHLRQIHT